MRRSRAGVKRRLPKALVASLGLLHPQILSLEVVPFKGGRSALSGDERNRVLDVLHGEAFADKAPAETYAKLLDQGTYLCSIRTMYRILEAKK